MSPERSSAPRPPASLSGRIDRLFAVNHPPEEPHRPYRNREILDACKAKVREMTTRQPDEAAQFTEISESHLSELRRGIKNPSRRTLRTLAAVFDVPVQYLDFSDPAVAEEVEIVLAVREAELPARLETEQRDQEELRAAARKLQQAIRTSGVTGMAHRATRGGMDPRQKAAMMRALADVILDDEDDEDDLD